MKRLIWVLASLLAACGGQQADLGRSSDATASNRALLAPALLQFNSDWTVQSFGAITHGGTVNIQYAFDRLQACTGVPVNGQPQWTVTAFFQVDQGPVGSTVVGGAGQVQPSFTLPAEGDDLAVWFEETNPSGCVAYDSAYGANYHFAIRDYPVIHFRPDWTTGTDGVLPGSSGVLLDYDLSRLPSCRQDYNGLPTWDILAWYRWNGGAASSVSVTQVNGYTRGPAEPLLAVPSGGGTLELWFENSDRAGCVGWDSAYGANYRFGF